MAKLSNSWVLRGGRTANNYVNANTTIEGKIWDSEDPAVHITFNLASKGGGITEVSVHLSEEDFISLAELHIEKSRLARKRLLKKIAKSM